MNSRIILASGLLFMLLAVALGAFGAHAIRATVNAEQMDIWQTASEYHFYHALGLVALGVWMESRPANLLCYVSGVLLVVGILLFCGSLYLMVLTHNPALGIITPIGGVLFLLAWMSWLLALFSANSNRT